MSGKYRKFLLFGLIRAVQVNYISIMACVFIYKWESNKNICFNKLDKKFSRICSTQFSLMEWWKFFIIGTLITYKEL